MSRLALCSSNMVVQFIVCLWLSSSRLFLLWSWRERQWRVDPVAGWRWRLEEASAHDG